MGCRRHECGGGVVWAGVGEGGGGGGGQAGGGGGGGEEGEAKDTAEVECRG